MLKLTYRGINYKSQTTDIQTPVDKCGSKNDRDFDRLISIKPMHYYTYRGVSYIKTIISDRDKRILLALDRQ